MLGYFIIFYTLPNSYSTIFTTAYKLTSRLTYTKLTTSNTFYMYVNPSSLHSHFDALIAYIHKKMHFNTVVVKLGGIKLFGEFKNSLLVRFYVNLSAKGWQKLFFKYKFATIQLNLPLKFIFTTIKNHDVHTIYHY